MPQPAILVLSSQLQLTVHVFIMTVVRYKGKFVKRKNKRNKEKLIERNRLGCYTEKAQPRGAQPSDLAVCAVFNGVGLIIIDPKHLAKVRSPDPIPGPVFNF